MLTGGHARVELAHTPTPLEPLPNLSRLLGGPSIHVKRDDCTGLAMGGNKARQLEFYLGDAVARGADTVLTTGAVQSNHVRMTVAAARKLGLDVEVQLEHRVEGRGAAYAQSGNPFLMKLMGARIHHYPVGEDEAGADQAMYRRAEEIRRRGGRPYVIPLGGDHSPLGALGYVDCAEELLRQLDRCPTPVAGVVLASGSATTHAGLLAGLRASGSRLPVYGFCVRRDRQAQWLRIRDKYHAVCKLIDHSPDSTDTDVWVDDRTLHPGYGQLNAPTVEAIRLSACHEGLLLDPTYSGKSMAGLIDLIRHGHFDKEASVVYLHTGGAPGLFGYPELLDDPSYRPSGRSERGEPAG